MTARRNRYMGDARASSIEIIKALKESIFALLMPIIILGGIYGGIFTPTEAANVAVVYGLFVGLFVYRELKWSDIPEILKASAISSSLVMLIIATASAFGLILTREAIPAQIAEIFLGITSNPVMLLVLINIMLLVIGTFMETNAAIIILAPIFFPVIMKMGINPVHFGVIMVANLAIGMITPPLGVNLFVSCGLTKLKIEQVVRANWYYLAASMAVMGAITYFPALSMWLPNLLM
jgi:C4-dicarboxylate transporter DctM subunit